MAELNLKERVCFLERRFKDVKVSLSVLSRIYKAYGIKKKLTLVRKGNSKKYPPEEVDKLSLRTHERVQELLEKGYEIFQADETIFSAQDQNKWAFSCLRSRITMEECKSSSQRLAVLGAVSSKTGKMTFITKKKFFDRHDVVGFLKLLRSQYPRTKLAVFWDNCPTHFSLDVSEAAFELKVELIRNVPYKPQFNGIERVWARMKW